MRGLERIIIQLLDAEADAFLLDIDGQHFDLNVVTLVVALNGSFAGQCPIDIGQMDHPEHFARQFDEESKFSDILDLALKHGAFGILLLEGRPWIGQALLEAKADTPLVRIDIEHHDFDFLARRNNLAGMDIFLGPTHF